LSIGSTDANVPLSRGFPAVCVGLTTGGGAHTMTEFINISPIAKGLALLVGIVRRVFSNMG
jgi:di/tripeptidase